MITPVVGASANYEENAYELRRIHNLDDRILPEDATPNRQHAQEICMLLYYRDALRIAKLVRPLKSIMDISPDSVNFLTNLEYVDVSSPFANWKPKPHLYLACIPAPKFATESRFETGSCQQESQRLTYTVACYFQTLMSGN